MWCVEEVCSKRVHVERSSGQTPIPVPPTSQTGLTTSLPPLSLNQISLFLSFFSSQVEERVMVLKDICRDPNALGKLEISNFEFLLKWHKNGLVTALLWGTILGKNFSIVSFHWQVSYSTISLFSSSLPSLPPLSTPSPSSQPLTQLEPAEGGRRRREGEVLVTAGSPRASTTTL